jgi:hypothetical protein
MSELFKEEDEEEVVEAVEPFEELELDSEVIDVPLEVSNLDARRRLESLLEEKRLRDELDDFIDY